MAHYHADMAAADAAAKRVHWDSSLAETHERRMRQDEESDQRRHKECVRRTRFNDDASPSGS
jgi:hypothetical protein